MPFTRKLLVATTNRDKFVEIAAILEGVPFLILTLADFAGVAAAEETGLRLIEELEAHRPAASGSIKRRRLFVFERN